ncbi:hypothetical protein Sfum_1072 [Syntrophobacter fumaroxidans MPOB]|uniref:Uncharacterized protein n=1 Tax=Syntrophobacter fumaroxidans (strain DSM 10017 / MPOB) TaxID=335543 RepID=A0LH64_SYNFM|nr:hypothetical protein Sfum_1072 [Syntrophobacter fumaroxidans MPOB]
MAGLMVDWVPDACIGREEHEAPPRNCAGRVRGGGFVTVRHAFRRSGVLRAFTRIRHGLPGFGVNAAGFSIRPYIPLLTVVHKIPYLTLAVGCRSIVFPARLLPLRRSDRCSSGRRSIRGVARGRRRDLRSHQAFRVDNSSFPFIFIY